MGSQRRALLIDDDLDVLYYVDDLLKQLGFRTIKATSGAYAAEVAGCTDADVVVLDMGVIPRTEPESLAELASLLDATPTVIMTESVYRPDGETSPNRCFTPHPPDLQELEASLDLCLGVAIAGD